MSLAGLHHVRLKVRDLDATRAFACDFGLVEVEERGGLVYLRGVGAGAYHLVLEAANQSQFCGLAFEVDADDDLDRAVREHGARELGALDSPGGGRGVALTDPEGNEVQLVAGIARREPDPLPPPMILNQGPEKTRRGVWQHKASLGPPPLLRLGHIGLFIRDFEACDRWYREVLGLIPSDLLYAGAPNNIAGGFYRIDRGDEWVDHHTVAFFAMGKSDLHHLSFEVQNPEMQFVAHRWMTKQGHEPVWGVGRHPLGSHVFDVWRDPSGYRFETFSDTDLCTASAETGLHSIAEAQMDLWSDRNVEAYFS